MLIELFCVTAYILVFLCRYCEKKKKRKKQTKNKQKLNEITKKKRQKVVVLKISWKERPPLKLEALFCISGSQTFSTLSNSSKLYPNQDCDYILSPPILLS